jgi:hypothetical protein
MLNPQEDVFSIRIRPSAPGEHMLSQQLLVDVGVYMFTGENQPWCKPARSAVHSASIASFRLFDSAANHIHGDSGSTCPCRSIDAIV